MSPFYGVFGLGGAFLSGDVSDGVRMGDVFESQLDVWLEGGLRLDPHLALGLYVDVGVGDPSREIRDLCRADFIADCTATTGRVGLLLRHTFSPRAASTPWFAIGTGFEFGDVSIDEDHGGTSEELFSYSGWEMVRLMAGVDLRSNAVFGVGLYGGIALGRYSDFEEGIAFDPVYRDRFGVADDAFHTTVSAGVRFTLFP